MKAAEMLLALKPEERIKAISYCPSEDILQALSEKMTYTEWMVSQIKDVISQPLWPDDKKPDVSLNLNTINQTLGGNENGKKI